MKLGVTIFPTDYAIRPDDLARACEERGFESLWFPEHTHIPASRKTPYPARRRAAEGVLAHARSLRRADGGGGGDKDDQARDRHLPADRARSDRRPRRRSRRSTTCRTAASSSASAAAGTSRRWRTTAPRSNALEAAAEQVEAMKRDLDAGRGRVPRRARQLRPDLVLPEAGAEAAPADHPRRASRDEPERVVDYCDGWIPIGFALPDLPRASELHERAKAAGRDPQSIEVSFFWAPPDADALRLRRDRHRARRARRALPRPGRHPLDARSATRRWSISCADDAAGR